MKKIILLVILLTTGLFVNAQDKNFYYKMHELYGGWYKQLGGDGEWLANSKKWLDYWGIQFATGSRIRATVSSTGSWYFAAPSSEYSATKFNTINERLKSWSDIAIGTDKSFTAKSYFISDLSNNNTVYGVLGLGRNSDIAIRVLTDKWLRIGGKKGIAMWGNDNAESDDVPHVFLDNDGTLKVRNNIIVLTGSGEGLSLKKGANGDPTIRTSMNQWFRIGGKSGIYLWGNDNVENDKNPTMSIVEGNVGIGTSQEKPAYKLDIRNGSIRVLQSNIEMFFGNNNGSTTGWMGTKSNHSLCLGANNGEAIFIDGSQRVYVGLNIATINKIKTEFKNKYDLFVDKGILAEDYAIAPKSTWADFVFSKEYILPSLSYVENFITEKKHLPDIPSATQIAEEGYSQHEMNKVLLQKIEELMLYTIEQNKKIERLENELSSMKTK